MNGKTSRHGKFEHESGKYHEKGKQAVQDQSMSMEKSWVMMKDRTDKEHEEYCRRKLVPQVRCSIPERAVCDLETGVN